MNDAAKINEEEYIKAIKDYYANTDPFEAVAKSRRKNYQRFFNDKIIRNKKGLMLDIGCGYGEFLLIAKKFGWSVSGVEVSEKLVTFGKTQLDLEIICKDFMEIIDFDHKYDVITMWNVFDQLKDPSSALKKIKSILKNDGMFFIRIPNNQFHKFALKNFTILKKLFGIQPTRSLKPIFHIHNFSKNEIVDLLLSEGFEIVKVSNSRPTSGDPYSGGRFVGLIKMITYLLASIIYYLSLGKIIMAPSMEIYAQYGKN